MSMEHKRLLVQPEDTTDDEGGYDSVSEDIELDCTSPIDRSFPFHLNITLERNPLRS